MLLAVGVLGVMMVTAVATFDSRSLIALVVVLVAAAAGGIGFSWKGYYKRRVPHINSAARGQGLRPKNSTTRATRFCRPTPSGPLLTGFSRAPLPPAAP